MDNTELKKALLNRQPVLHTMGVCEDYDIEYKYISAIIYRVNKKGEIEITAELLDRNNRSVTIADPKKIRYK